MNHPTPGNDTLQPVTEILNSFFDESIKNAAAIDPSYVQLWKTLHELIQSGGKRLRPQMTLLAYKAFGGTNPASIAPVAAAQELLHFSLLIHDDIIDRDYTRYGTANVAGCYRSFYSEYLEDEEEQVHFAHGAAILGGDLMLAGAFKLVALSPLSDEEKTLAHTLLSKSMFEVAGGELLDTELSFKPYNDGDALTVARFKTASYSFATPLLTGASLAGATSFQLAALKELATELGIAFQLVDDLLGVFGDEGKTGKSTTSDIVEGKRTYLIEKALKLMSDADRAQFEVSFGEQHASDEEIEAIKQLLISCGAKAEIEQKVKEHATKARAHLDTLGIAPLSHNEFLKLITKVTERAF